MRRISTSIAFALSTLLLVSISSAQQTSTTAVPNLIRYSGILKDSPGAASVSTTTVGVTFAIYNQQDGGAPIWQETQNVTLDSNCQYSVLLGSATATGLPDDLFSQQEQRWLGVQMQGQAEQPRVLLVSVPYAFKAHEAETLGGLPVSAFLRDPLPGQSNPTNNDNSPSEYLRTKPDFVNGRGSTNYVPIWLNPVTLGSSAIYQTGGNVGIGTTTPAATLDVNGGINSATTYQIIGSSVLNIGRPADRNLFLGVNAGANNVAGSGVHNTFSGYAAGYSNTTGNSNTFSGYLAGYSNTSSTGNANTFSGAKAGYSNTTASGNTFYGFGAGYSNTTSTGNTFVGNQAGYSNTGDSGTGNTFSGYQAGYSNTIGNSNTFSGYQAGYSNTSGTGNANTFYGAKAGYSNTIASGNTFYGVQAGYSNTIGNGNTFSGDQAGYNNSTGSNNTFVGSAAGLNNTSGYNDIYIGNNGPGSGNEINTIRIGGDTGFGSQAAAYVAGIYGATASGGVPVYVNSNGQLGTITSSLRFKDQVRDMGNSTSALMKLRPVTFFYKPEYANGERTLQYGLIAEEVAEVYPELVANDKDGQPYTVRYQYLTTMLLNEAQKQYHRAEAEAKVITSQEEKIEQLEQRLTRLEGLVRGKVQPVAQERN